MSRSCSPITPSGGPGSWPTDPARSRGRHVNLDVFVSGRDEVQRSVLAGLGFRISGHYASLIRPDFASIPDLPLPDGLEVRPIDPADRAMHRRVYDAAARAFADSTGEEKPSEAKFDEFVSDPSFAPALWQVAFDGDRIAGQILNYLGDVEPDGTRIGFTENISVQPEHRRRGLARALLARSLRVVRDAGATCAGPRRRSSESEPGRRPLREHGLPDRVRGLSVLARPDRPCSETTIGR